MPKFHGLKLLNTSGTSGELHFAIVNLAKAVEQMLAFPGLNKYPTLRLWSSEEVNRLLLASGKLRDTFWKIDRLLTLLDEARLKFVNFQPPTVEAEQIAKHQQAQQDFPLFLDAVLVYLKIFADCLANFTAQLPCFPKKNQISPTFREQMKGFLNSKKNMDPEYAVILDKNTDWFRTLAGEGRGRGLRNLVVHGLVRSDLFFFPGKTSEQNRVLAILYGPKPRSAINVLPELQNLLMDLFDFLDLYTAHFTARIEKAIGGSLPGPIVSLQYQFNDHRLPSDWLYPQIT